LRSDGATDSLVWMIDVRTEHLLPVADLPDYLQSRGFGRRVTMRVVKRWIREGCSGMLLEVVRIDDSTLTSLEAVQRWVEAQTVAAGQAAGPPRSPSPDLATLQRQEASPEHESSVHLLVEHRVMRTDLDRLMHSLPDHAVKTIAYAAGVLFRTGLRTPEDARRQGLDQLLAIDGIGPRSALVIKSLWSALTECPRERRPGTPEVNPRHSISPSSPPPLGTDTFRSPIASAPAS